MLRFALLRHECPADYRDGPHWDLLLERPGETGEHRLATWSLLELPAAWVPAGAASGALANESVPADRLPDHRALYLTYEGPLTGGRGGVERVAAGEVVWLEESPERAVVELMGDAPFVGRLTLERQRRDGWGLFWAENPRHSR